MTIETIKSPCTACLTGVKSSALLSRDRYSSDFARPCNLLDPQFHKIHDVEDMDLDFHSPWYCVATGDQNFGV